MSIRWFPFFLQIWVLCAITSNIIEYLDPVTNTESNLVVLLTNSVKIFSTSDLLGAATVLFDFIVNFILAIVKALVFDYSFLSGTFVGMIVRFCCIVIISIPMFIGMVITLRGVISGRTV
jgi:hypothetical protein